jgi:hypothetical protein
MLILFDQGTPVGIRDSLHGHVIKTAQEQGTRPVVAAVDAAKPGTYNLIEISY